MTKVRIIGSDLAKIASVKLFKRAHSANQYCSVSPLYRSRLTRTVTELWPIIRGNTKRLINNTEHTFHRSYFLDDA